jgi:Spy/CpxP family protein refolding chaperone
MRHADQWRLLSMNAKSLVLTVLLASGAVALGAQSTPQPAPAPQPQPRMQQRGPRAGVSGDEGFVTPRQRLHQLLGLNETQAASLEKLMSEQRKAAIRQRADQRIARMELEELMGAETLDQKAIDAKIQQMTTLHASALRARVEQRMALQKILTPEQFKKWQQLRGPFGERGMRPRMLRGDRPMRWQDDRGRPWRMPMPPQPPDAPKPPAAPQGEPIR